MTPDFFEGLTDEDLALQCDAWRYASESHERGRRYGLAKWCRRLSNAHADELIRRQTARSALEFQGRQQAFPMPESILRPPTA